MLSFQFTPKMTVSSVLSRQFVSKISQETDRHSWFAGKSAGQGGD